MLKLLVFAGPNGSGKSTITSKQNIIGTYVNADDIKKHLSCTDIEAAQIAEATREHFLENNIEFTFETVLSTPRNISLMHRAKEKNYYVICIYVLTSDPQINIERVKQRKRNGGHDVPPDKVYQRYIRALNLFPQVLDICNELYVFDNSKDNSQHGSKIILRSLNGHIDMYPNEIWTPEKIHCLIDGTYSSKYVLSK